MSNCRTNWRVYLGISLETALSPEGRLSSSMPIQRLLLTSRLLSLDISQPVI